MSPSSTRTRTSCAICKIGSTSAPSTATRPARAFSRRPASPAPTFSSRSPTVTRSTCWPVTSLGRCTGRRRKSRACAPPHYTEREALFGENAVAVDVWISPEQLVTEYVARLIRYPGALQVLDFADGRVRLVGIRALQGGPLVGQALRTLREHIPGADARVAAIYRAGKSIQPEGDTVIEDGDEVFFLAARKDIRLVMKEMRKRGGAGAAGGHRRRRQHRLSARERARGQESGQAHRARQQARAAGLGAVEPHHGAARATPPTRSCCWRRISTAPTYSRR